MGSFRLVKCMTRQLSNDEEAEVLAFMKQPSHPTTKDAVEHFEKKFGMPVTFHCVERICVQDIMNEIAREAREKK